MTVALLIVLFNSFYLGSRGRSLAQRYPDASLPSPLSMVWGSLIIGTITVYLTANLTVFPGRLVDPSWGSGLPAVSATVSTVGWVLLIVDLRMCKLPRELTKLMATEVLVAWTFGMAFAGFPIEGLGGPLLAAALWLLPMLVGYGLKQVGQGDLRLAPVLGFALGTSSFSVALVGTLACFFAAAAFAMGKRSRGVSRNARFALGPFLIAGAWFSFALNALIPVLVPLTHS